MLPMGSCLGGCYVMAWAADSDYYVFGLLIVYSHIRALM